MSFLSWGKKNLYKHINKILIHDILCFFARTFFKYRKLKNLKNTIILWLKIDDNLLIYVRGKHSAHFKIQIVLSEFLSKKNLYEHINIILVHAILFFSAKTIFIYRKLKNLKTTIILLLKIYDKILLYVRGIQSVHFKSQIVISELGSKKPI